MSYGFHHKGLTFYPNGKPQAISAEETHKENRERSQAEIEAFKLGQHDRYFAYMATDRKRITT